MLRDKLIYIFLLVSFCSFGQSKMLQASIQQASGGAAPSELYTFGDAADPNNETNTVATGAGASGWHDNSGSDITFTSTTGDATSYAIRMELSSSNAARAELYIDLEAGVTYDYVIRGRASAATKVRILDPRGLGGDYASINSQPYMTTSWATYNLTLSPPTTDTYRIWFDFNGETSGDWGEIESISIIAQ